MTNYDKIKEFLTQIKTQDNRCTALPIYYQIRDFKKEIRPSGYGDYTVFYSPNYDQEFDSEEEMEDYYRKNEYYLEESDEDYENFFDEEFEKWKDNGYFEEYAYERVAVYKGMFLTETDALDHLRRNRHHYADDACTYVQHAWRAPELENFINNLMEYFEVGE